MARLKYSVNEGTVAASRNNQEADVTSIVEWRKKVKESWERKYKTKLTYMPIFIEAAARALRDFPMVNASVDGDNIIIKANVNIGIAVAKPDGNLIVPVIKGADKLRITSYNVCYTKLLRIAADLTVPDERRSMVCMRVTSSLGSKGFAM